MIVTTLIIMKRRNPNGSKISYHQSHRIATKMRCITRSYAEHVGVALYLFDGSRGRASAVGGKKSAHRRS